MKFATDETVSLRGTLYHILNWLARGAVADVYQARPASLPTCEVVVKVVRDDADQDPQKIAALRREAEVLKILNPAEDPRWPALTDLAARIRQAQETAPQRLVVALFDDGEITPGQPYLVQELAPPAFPRFEVETLTDERRMLAVAHALARVMALAHEHSLALKDFEPPWKLDRVRLRWLDNGERFELKVIDWDVTGGSEEAVQDFLFFGGHLYYLLLGQRLALENGQPPANLGLGISAWDRLTQGSRLILQRLLHRDPARRYQQAADLEADLAWWLEALRQAESPNVLGLLQDRIWQARPQNRHDRALAVADLALRLDIPPEARRMFDLWAWQAREELDKAIWWPIAQALGTLGRGNFSKAVDEFETAWHSLDPREEVARRARLFWLLAQAGQHLQQACLGADIRSTSEWVALTRAANALTKSHWEEARVALLEAARFRPEMENWLPIRTLRDWAEAGLLLQQAADLAIQAEPRRADADQPDWAQVEAEQITLLAQAIALLQKAQELAPLEPEFQDRLRSEQARLGLRQGLLARYQDAERFIEQGNNAFQEGPQIAGDLAAAAETYRRATDAFQAAIDELEDILKADPVQHRARLFLDRLQPRYREAQERWQTTERHARGIHEAGEALAQAQALLRQGAYGEALPLAKKAAKQTPDREEVQQALAEAQAGAQLVRLVYEYLEAARQRLQMDNLEEAENQIKQFLPWQGQSLATLPGGEHLSPVVGGRLFRLPPDVGESANALLEEIRFTREVDTQVQKARSRYDYPAVIAALEQKEKRGYLPTDKEKGWWEEASQRLAALEQAEELLGEQPDFPALRQVVKALESDPSPQAGGLRDRAGDAWRRRCEEPMDLGEVGKCLREGLLLFQNMKVAEDLQRMLGLVAGRSYVASDLVIAEGMAWPDWFGAHPGELPDLGSRLSRLAADLEVLRGEGTWPVLREQVRVWRGQLVGYLAAFLHPELDAARACSRQRNFVAALQTAERSWNVVPEAFQPDVPPDIGHQGLVPLIVSLRARLKADDAMLGLTKRLAQGDLLTEVARAADQIVLQDHPDVPVDDLRIFIDDLKRAAGLPFETYAHQIYYCQRLPQHSEVLRGYLSETARGMAGKLLEALQTEARAFVDRPAPDPKQFLSLYWQARWWETTVGERSENIQKTREVARTLLERAATTFAGMKDDGDLDRVKRILGHLETLNRELASPVEALPLLPPGKQYDGLESPLNPGALEGFEREVAYFAELAGQAAKPIAQPGSKEEIPETASLSKYNQAGPNMLPLVETYNQKQVMSVQLRARQLQDHLDHLKKIWLALKLRLWPEDANLHRMERETELHAAVATALDGAYRSWKDRGTMAGLATLYTKIEGQARMQELDEFSLWLLVPQRAALKSAFATLRQDLVAALGSGQIVPILEEHATAVERLREFLDGVPSEAGWIADAVYDAVLRAVGERTEQAMSTGRQDEARRLWQIVMDATQPWAASPAAQSVRPPLSKRVRTKVTSLFARSLRPFPKERPARPVAKPRHRD